MVKHVQNIKENIVPHILQYFAQNLRTDCTTFARLWMHLCHFIVDTFSSSYKLQVINNINCPKQLTGYLVKRSQDIVDLSQTQHY